MADVICMIITTFILRDRFGMLSDDGDDDDWPGPSCAHSHEIYRFRMRFNCVCVFPNAMGLGMYGKFVSEQATTRKVLIVRLYIGISMGNAHGTAWPL